MTAIFKLRPLKFIIIKKVKSQDKKTEGKIISENETVVILGFFFQTGLSTVKALYPLKVPNRPNDCLDTTNYKQK